MTVSVSAGQNVVTVSHDNRRIAVARMSNRRTPRWQLCPGLSRESRSTLSMQTNIAYHQRAHQADLISSLASCGFDSSRFGNVRQVTIHGRSKVSLHPSSEFRSY